MRALYRLDIGAVPPLHRHHAGLYGLYIGAVAPLHWRHAGPYGLYIGAVRPLHRRHKGATSAHPSSISAPYRAVFSGEPYDYEFTNPEHEFLRPLAAADPTKGSLSASAVGEGLLMMAGDGTARLLGLDAKKCQVDDSSTREIRMLRRRLGAKQVKVADTWSLLAAEEIA